MKQSIKLILLLLVVVALYGVYLMIAFKPDEPYEFVFKDPVLPPELVAQQKADQAEASLSPAERAKKDAAMAQTQIALDKYQQLETALPKQAASTISVLMTYFYSGDLPTHFLADSDPLTGQRRFGSLEFGGTQVIAPDNSNAPVSCAAGNRSQTLLGNTAANVIECNSIGQTGLQGDLLVLAGPGNDRISDAQGNRVINAGSGDDVITLGTGRSIVILEDGWGKDQLTLDCSGSSVSPLQVPADFPASWPYSYTNFIILSPAIDPNDLYWDGLVLKRKSGDDTLTVNEKCFTIIPAATVSTDVPAAPDAGPSA